MLNLDEDAVICDLAETYQIYDWRSLPLQTVATFVCGLGQNSRIKRKFNNDKYEDFTVSEFLLMNIADALSIIAWQNTANGQKGVNRPKLFTEQIENKQKSKALSFNSIDDFNKKRQELLRSNNNG